MAEKVERFGVSLPKELLADLDHLVRERGYKNRSKALADCVRNQLFKESVDEVECIGAITFIYDHEVPHIMEEINQIQHHTRGIITSSHVHLEGHLCAETVFMKSMASSIRHLSDRIGSLRGVKVVRTALLPAQVR
ncbi:MAG: nickel-responsive transcriptional regulator NikR [Candidatus Altiarchaeota archaeon]|nr:nickel-responsive transcriptional regulator NikR [Candidatus Altiarchaeota archaeon]